MTWNEVFCNTFKVLSKEIEPEVKKKIDFTLPSMPMVNACRADDFDFFRPLIDSGDLTIDQMHHAAQRYLLGKSRSGQPIFWMIDDLGTVYDGHLGPTWVSTTLKSRAPLLQYWRVKHCLFGLHLLSQSASREKNHPDPLMGRGYLNERATGGAVKSSHIGEDLDRVDASFSSFLRAEEKDRLGFKGVSPLELPISIVESEQTAVLLSELLPESLWMAYCDTPNLTLDLLEPLQGCTVMLFPRTDPTMSNYLFFLDYANQVRQIYPSIHLTVDNTLEENATDAQKSCCIDLLDFILA